MALALLAMNGVLDWLPVTYGAIGGLHHGEPHGRRQARPLILLLTHLLPVEVVVAAEARRTVAHPISRYPASVGLRTNHNAKPLMLQHGKPLMLSLQKRRKLRGRRLHLTR